MLGYVSPDVVEGMACVANYINEMQRVSETYSSLFHTILSENSHTAPVRSSYIQFAWWYNSFPMHIQIISFALQVFYVLIFTIVERKFYRVKC